MTVGEWDQRQLCPDACTVGVIGPDGTCKVCGRAAPNWGDERTRGLLDPPDDDEPDDDEDDEDDGLAANDGAGGDEDDDDDDDDDDADEHDSAGDDGAGRAADGPERALGASSSTGWSARHLCPDGACIGVIGLDGRCKVCGRAATASAVEQAEDGAMAPAADGTAKARVDCPDAACPGAIGADGHCDVCGKVAA